jgi:hypothetical protein
VPDLTVHRSHRVARSQWINRALKKPPQGVKLALQSVLSKQGCEMVKRAVRRANELKYPAKRANPHVAGG